MVHRWKWHECLEAREDINSTDSECENEEYVKHAHRQDSNAEDIFSVEQQLKDEAKIALAVSAQMARMQVQIERDILTRKRSSFYDIIGINMNLNKPWSIEILEEMNIGQLQVIVNDLYCQIEVNNDQLIDLLTERDSLSMEQDSILVDIEDLTKRLQERANAQLFEPPPPPPPAIPPKQSLFQKIFSKIK